MSFNLFFYPLYCLETWPLFCPSSAISLDSIWHSFLLPWALCWFPAYVTGSSFSASLLSSYLSFLIHVATWNVNVSPRFCSQPPLFSLCVNSFTYISPSTLFILMVPKLWLKLSARISSWMVFILPLSFSLLSCLSRTNYVTGVEDEVKNKAHVLPALMELTIYEGR